MLRSIVLSSGVWCVPIASLGLLHLISIIHHGLRPMRARFLYATLGVTLVVQPWLLASQVDAAFGKTILMDSTVYVLHSVTVVLGPTITFGAVLVLSAVFEIINRVARARTVTKHGVRTASTP